MISRRRFVILWTGGLAAFAVTLWLHLPLVLETVPQGIVEHQTAGNAARVDFIQREWSAAGVYRAAFTAMVSDIVFILLFGLGSLLGGLHFRRSARAAVRLTGHILLVAALVFLASDLTETVLQLRQLLAGEGEDTSAVIAAAMQYPKVASWTACFILPLIALVLERRAMPER
jgi:hypothetical protein